MQLKNLMLLGVAALLTTPVFASSYFGGMEDSKGLDYDYNDAVFSLSGNNLTLNSATGKWFAQPTLGTSATPFWNRSSLDGLNYNVGYCVYGGGSCNGGIALDAGAQYLANSTSKTGSTNDVTFSSTGQVVLNVYLQIASAKNVFGWYSTSDPADINWLNPNSANGSYAFDPHGTFGLVDKNGSSVYYSQTQYGTQDDLSHFAFFSKPQAVAPEPGMAGLLSLGLSAFGAAVLRRKRMNHDSNETRY